MSSHRIHSGVFLVLQLMPTRYLATAALAFVVAAPVANAQDHAGANHATKNIVETRCV